MKHLLSLLLALTLLCCALPALAETVEDIAGTWTLATLITPTRTITDPASVHASKVMELDEDGSAVVTVQQTVYQATWSVEGSTLHLLYEDGDRSEIAIEPDQLVYQAGDQTQILRRRVNYADAADFVCRPISDTETKIVSYRGAADVLYVPPEINGYAVRAIERTAFASTPSLVRVILPNGIETVGEWAFARCENLASVTLPQTVTFIGNSAFYGCKNLKKVRLPEGLETIENSLFAQCASLGEVKVPAGVRAVGMLAFDGCASLSEIALPEGVERIGDGAFNDCVSLTRISLPASVNRIDGAPFSGCGALQVSAPAGSYALSYFKK